MHAARSEETDCCCAEVFARVPSCFVTLSLHVASTVAAPTTSPFSTCSSAPVNRCCAFLKSTLKLTEPPAVVTAGLVLTLPPAVAVAPALFEPALSQLRDASDRPVTEALPHSCSSFINEFGGSPLRSLRFVGCEGSRTIASVGLK